MAVVFFILVCIMCPSFWAGVKQGMKEDAFNVNGWR